MSDDIPKTVWKFSAMDSLFFRDGSPMNMGESAWVDSVFPPSGQTLQGAIRAAILDYLDADIRAFQKGKDCLPDNGGSLKDEIGDACSLGGLRLTGPFLERNDEVFFPAPLNLVKNKDNAYALLCPSEKPVRCDMDDSSGIRLPAAAGPGWKPLNGKYISAAGMQEVLRGDVAELQDESHGPKLASLIGASCDEPALADREPKIGLARETQNVPILKAGSLLLLRSD
ncbi:MAG: hypothetical protein D3908_13925 [Candidatus Electrothrix sp. AUS4]|nr:hypothetical protein [Candidatus Electrothrix sp. AUS4]